MLEQEILHSMIYFPQDVESFFENTPKEVFSPSGWQIAEAIQKLEKNVSMESLLSVLSDEIKQSEYFLNLLATTPDPNYLAKRMLFFQEYNLRTQASLAQNLLNACAQNVLLDIDTLKKPQLESKEFKNFREWKEYEASRPQLPKVKSGIEFLDSCFDGGFEMGALMLISGDPEAGKTMLGAQIIENIARVHKVGFFCFEFTIASYLKAKFNARHKINEENIFIINDEYDIYSIVQNIKALYKKGVRVFLIDSQMRITSPQARNMEEEESLKFQSLAKLAHSLGIFIMLIVQTSKNDRDNPMGSKKGAHEASIIVRIEHAEVRKDDIENFGALHDPNARYFLVKKNKQTGKHFKIKVGFNPQTLRFSSLESAQEPEVVLDLEEVLSIAKGI